VSAHLTEEEQIQALKRWWSRFGVAVVSAAVVASASYFGYGFYEKKQTRLAEASSARYDALLLAAGEGDTWSAEDKTAVVAAAKAVLKDDNDSLYADLARFHLAKVAVEDADYAQAETALVALVANSRDPSSKALAQLRLARVKAAQGQADEALKLLANPAIKAFSASYAEMRGDILLGQGQYAEAYAAYESALAAIEGGEQGAGMAANILKFKLDGARVAAASPVEQVTQPDAAPAAPKTPAEPGAGS
jgi:predicted negative regulator of RcsB-dependent stress response